jgi:Zn-dependent metalloprotease
VNIENHPFSNVQVVSAKTGGYGIDTSLIKSPSEIPASAQNDCEIFDKKMGTPLEFSPHQCTPMVINSHGVAGIDDSAIRAANNALNVLTYYWDVHGRDSYDGKGSDLISVVHAGENWQVALWNPTQSLLAYGDGDGITTRDFTYALDIAGHEVTHGVVESTPSPMLYFGESGAVNEANSDFFGVMINGAKSWVFGKDAYIKETGMRDLADPHSMVSNITFHGTTGKSEADKVPYPATLKEMLPKQSTCDINNDNCWAHINSTVTSHARYLVTKAIGIENAQKLYYLVMTQALNSGTTVKSEAQDTLRLCKQEFGPTSETCEQVKTAYAQVGIAL